MRRKMSVRTLIVIKNQFCFNKKIIITSKITVNWLFIEMVRAFCRDLTDQGSELLEKQLKRWEIEWKAATVKLIRDFDELK